MERVMVDEVVMELYTGERLRSIMHKFGGNVNR